MNINQSSMLAMATLAAAAASGVDFFDHAPATGHAAPIGKGRIASRDNGKGQKVQPRNSPCMCGSGMKAKRCCVYVTQTEERK